MIHMKVGFDSCFTVGSIGNGGGRLFQWKKYVDVSVCSFSIGHIDSLICQNGFPWRFIGFYNSPIAFECSHSWSLLSCLAELDDLPWVVGKDFNEIINNFEKQGDSRDLHRVCEASQKLYRFLILRIWVGRVTLSLGGIRGLLRILLKLILKDF